MKNTIKHLGLAVIAFALVLVLGSLCSPKLRAALTPVYSSAATYHNIVSTGTFVANGASNVTVTDANIAVGANVVITLNTVGGTVGQIPHLMTITAGTSFAVAGTASDTSTYSYMIIN